MRTVGGPSLYAQAGNPGGVLTLGMYLYFSRFFTLHELFASIESITHEDIQQIAQEFFQPKHIAVTVLVNFDGFKLSRSQLAC